MQDLHKKRLCKSCGIYKPLSEWGRYRSWGTGYINDYKWSSYCKACGLARNHIYYIAHREEVLARKKKYKQTLAGKATQNRGVSKWVKRNPEKKLAHEKLIAAVRAGKLKRESCEICGTEKTEAHHYKGYEPEHWYDVQWLCKPHHRDIHGFSLRSRGITV